MVEAGWYSFFNWNGFGRPEKFIGLKNYVYVSSNPAFTRALINNGLIIVASLLVQLPLALGVALLDRRAHDGRGVVPDGLLPAVHPRGCRGGPHLALHARRADWPPRHRHQPLRSPAVFLAREHGLGVHRRAHRDLVEIFRLPHDALYRRPSGHRQGDAGGGRDGRRQALPAVLAHHAAPAWAR